MLDKIISGLQKALGGLMEGVMKIFVDWTKESILDPLITACKNTGDNMFSGFISNAMEILQKSPNEWNAQGWAYVVGVTTNVFVILGCQFVCVFFLIGFLSDSLDPRHDIRLETIMKGLFKLILAEFLVCNVPTMINYLFDFVKVVMKFIGLTPGGYSLGTDIINGWNLYDLSGNSITFTGALHNTLDGGILLLTVVFAFVYLLAMIGSGAIIAYTAYIRFFKLLAIIPYGALATSTIAGNHELSRTAISFYKYILGVVFESVTIVIAVGVFYSITRGGMFEIIKAQSADMIILTAFINRTMLVLLLVGVVKGAGAMTQKALAL